MKNMKPSARIALCGMMAALSIVIMFLSGLIPSMTIALPALAGCMLIPVTAECGTKYGFTVFAAVAFLGFFLVADREAWLMFVLFFGYYPVLFGVLARIKKRGLCFAVKMLIFTAACVAEGLISVYLLSIPMDEIGPFGRWSVLILLALAEVVFVIYDRCIGNLISLYFARFRRLLNRLFRF